MHKLVRFARLPGLERALLRHAFFLLWLVRLGLWFVPFQTLRQRLTRLSHILLHAKTPLPVEKIAWAVRAASKGVPRATCLTQALAAQVLFARHAHAVDLKIGVAKGDAGGLEAHAWLEHGGRVVVGNVLDLGRYVPLAAKKEVS